MRTSPGPAPWVYGPRPTASPPSTTSATARSSVSRIEVVEDPHRFGEQRVVVAGLFLDAAEHRLEAPGVGHGDPVHVQKMHHGAERRERRVVVEAETRQQDFEGHAIVDVRELGTVEVEADGLPRTLARPLDPCEPGVPIDEPLDEPGAGEAIDPRILASRPHALLVAGLVDELQSLPGGARLAAGIGVLKAPFESGDGLGSLPFRLSRKEIDLRELVERALQALHGGLRLAVSKPRQGLAHHADLLRQRAIVRAPVK